MTSLLVSISVIQPSWVTKSGLGPIPDPDFRVFPDLLTLEAADATDDLKLNQVEVASFWDSWSPGEGDRASLTSSPQPADHTAVQLDDDHV